MAVIKYKHCNGDCTFETDLEVNHRKTVFFKCPVCNWISDFRPVEDYDETDSFKLNPFTIIDTELFEFKKPKRKSKGSTNKTKSIKKFKPKNATGTLILSFPYTKIKKLIDDGNYY